MTRFEQVSEAQPAAEAPATAGWITLTQASRLVGVNESTLRRWADSGQVHTFRTPGGHRRFSLADLQGLTAGAPLHPREVEHGNLEDLALSRIRRRLQRPRQGDASWYQTLREDERLRLRLLGRRLVTLISDYLTAGAKRNRRGRLVDEAREIGHEYGRELSQGGTPLRDA